MEAAVEEEAVHDHLVQVAMVQEEEVAPFDYYPGHGLLPVDNADHDELAELLPVWLVATMVVGHAESGHCNTNDCITI